MSQKVEKFFSLFLLGNLVSLTMSLYAQKSLDPGLCIVGSGCLAVAQSPYSQVFGIKISLLGVLWTCVVAVVWFMRYGSRTTKIVSNTIVLVGLGFASWLQFVSWVLLKTWCFWCLFSFLCVCGIALCWWLGQRSQTIQAPSPRIQDHLGLSSLACLGVIPYLLIARIDRTYRESVIDEWAAATLSKRLEGANPAKSFVLFTDFACPHCFEDVPKFFAQAKQLGVQLVVAPVTFKPEVGTEQTACYYYVAKAKGFGQAFVDRFPGPIQLVDYNQTAKRELDPTDGDMSAAGALVTENNRLFQRLGLSGTPQIVCLRNRRIIATTDIARILRAIR